MEEVCTFLLPVKNKAKHNLKILELILCSPYDLILTLPLCISEFELNTDYPGNDLNPGCNTNTPKTDTPYKCLELCQKTAECKGFSWEHPDVGWCPNGCWLKNKMANKKQKTNVISGFASAGKLPYNFLFHNEV